jgi:hypothetical protein
MEVAARTCTVGTVRTHGLGMGVEICQTIQRFSAYPSAVCPALWGRIASRAGDSRFSSEARASRFSSSFARIAKLATQRPLAVPCTQRLHRCYSGAGAACPGAQRLGTHGPCEQGTRGHTREQGTCGAHTATSRGRAPVRPPGRRFIPPLPLATPPKKQTAGMCVCV